MIKKTKTILVVDDDSENIRTYGEFLMALGYRVITAGDVDEGLAVLNANNMVDLVITDYRMPGKTGLDFILALRQLRPLLPVVLITAYGNIETYLHTMSLGAFEYVNKPINIKEFERIVRNALLSDRGRKNPPGKDVHEQHTYHR
jgi:DNA-binding NtrC family response regulator